MAKVRVYEIARELEVDSKDILEKAAELGIEVKTASSGLDDEAADLLRLAFGETSESAAPPEPGPAPVLAPPPPPPTPEAAEPPPPPAAEPPPRGGPEPELIEVPEGVTVQQFAQQVGRSVGEVVKSLIGMGKMVNATMPVPADALDDLAESYGYVLTVATPAPVAPVEEAGPVSLRPTAHAEDRPEDLVARPPVVTVMGHVDHGKTKLLDAIRKANVVAGEAGGITQHIGAYQVTRNGRKITFIDTPGHEAFTALRARGANVTDIVVLVVAADDGVMPQTAEAISHAKAAGVPVVVAINKVDLPDADPHSVRAGLTGEGLVVEQLGGDVTSAEVSAITGQGVDHLLELVDLVAELEDLRANPKAPAEGVVIESNLDKGRGPVATVIVQRGTLKVGSALVAGPTAGKVRAMLDENGKQLKEAGPSTPVLVMGWDDVPGAGERFRVVDDERTARSLATEAMNDLRARQLVTPTPQERMAQLLEELRTADQAELRLIVKADAHGSLEAIRDAVGKIQREGGYISFIHTGVGGINESDILLAEASGAVVIGFNVRPDPNARKAADEAGIEIRTYRIIYQLIDEVEQMLVGRLAPEEVEDLLGTAEVRAVFRVPRLGAVAGSYVTEGEITRGAKARLVRQGVVVYDGSIASLRRFKDDVRSVASGYECGIGLENYRDVKEGDIIEVYRVREVVPA